MYEDILAEIGLTKSEIAVYFALLKIGSSTTGKIIKESKISSGKAYLILDKLILKGLVTYVIKSGKKHFHAKDPERLIDYLDEKTEKLEKKKKKLKKIIPSLKAEFKEKNPPLAEVYEGIKGFKTFYDWSLKELKKGETIDIMGAPKKANEKFQAYFMEWNKKRVKIGIKMRILYNHNCKIYGEKRKKLKLTQVRYMREQLETPAWINIFKDYVVTINVHDDPICFLIKNKESAISYNKYFELLWKQAKN
jgi:HTH-type transcriptional regulator, sugar sensing transcriptional regulator